MSVHGESPPAPGTPRAYHFPLVVRQRLAVGTRILAASLTKVPLVTVTAVFHHAGAEYDPAGREGLADLTALMLLEGNAQRDGAALAEYFEALGSSLSASADWDTTTLSFTVHPARLSLALVALREVLRTPAFAPSDLTRLKSEHRAARMQITADPRSLADAAFTWNCYSARSRYRRPVSGTLTTVDAISRDDVVAFWRARFGPAALSIIIAGDLPPESAIAAAERLVEDWHVAEAGTSEIVAAKRDDAMPVMLVEKDGAAQTELRVGHLGPPRTHPDYFNLTVMNAVLGGLFSSRINLNLRERHGYTYGASSGFDWRTKPGPWVVSTAVRTEVTAAAVREILAEIERMRSTEIARDELELAANYLVGVFPLRFETTTAVAGALFGQAVFDLPDDYFDTYRARIAAVTTEDILRVAKQQIDPGMLQVIAVGDPGVLHADLASLQLADVRRIAPEQVEAAP